MHNQSLLYELSFFFFSEDVYSLDSSVSFEEQFLFPCAQRGGVTYGEAGLVFLTLKFLWVSKQPICIFFILASSILLPGK